MMRHGKAGLHPKESVTTKVTKSTKVGAGFKPAPTSKSFLAFVCSFKKFLWAGQLADVRYVLFPSP
jgi:hypothetical protein